ncbi:MAG: beta-hydroxyacyl-ACP dehydratase [Planctomycetota bacterium]|nr:MAG: beta-hydroxyacyl-ACP dehydratase [Planctomycetota bacterium]
MKFILIDKIEAIEPGKRIVTTKQLTLAEEYLADHFPVFPVMPGVLMLEGMTQSAAWLVRLAQEYDNSVIVLKSARNVKYNYFLKPGNTIRYEVEAMSIDGGTAKFKGCGYVGERLAVSARLELACKSLAGLGNYGKGLDEQVNAQNRRTFELAGGPAALAAAGSC